MNITYRILLPADAAAYRNLRLECLAKHPDNFGTGVEEERCQPELKFEKIIKTGSTDSFMMGVFDEERLVGLCGFNREDRLKTKHRGEIVQMYVDATYAGKHIGPSLLNAAIKRAFESGVIEQIALSLVHQNERANRVYEKLGFEEYGRIKNYFKAGSRYWDQRFMILRRDTWKPFVAQGEQGIL